MLICNGQIIIGYVAFIISGFYYDPNDTIIPFLLSISVGAFGIYGFLTIGYVIVNQNCGNTDRGAIMGFNCLFGAIAILIITQAGGYSVDNLSSSSPFYFAAFCSLILFIITLIPSIRKDLDSDKHFHHHAGHPQNPNTVNTDQENHHSDKNAENIHDSEQAYLTTEKKQHLDSEQ